MHKFWNALWYSKPRVTSRLQKIVGHIYFFCVALRKKAYEKHIFKTYRAPVPVVIIGNITVGGTGKSPLLMALADLLKKSDFHPGIISRGYGGKSSHYPLHVLPTTPPQQSGDEALMIAKRTQCPVFVSPNRPEAIKALLTQHPECNVILSDDGLQHWAMARDIEIMVIDGERRFGNGCGLPFGPLREPIERKKTVDFIVTNGEKTKANESSMTLQPDCFVHIATQQTLPLDYFNTTPVHAIAGIGNFHRFLKTLDTLNLNYQYHEFPDHHRFTEEDFVTFNNKPIIMTEKDAVKCTHFSQALYYLKVTPMLDPTFEQHFLEKLHHVS